MLQKSLVLIQSKLIFFTPSPLPPTVHWRGVTRRIKQTRQTGAAFFFSNFLFGKFLELTPNAAESLWKSGVGVFSSHEKHTMMHEWVASCHRGCGSFRVHVCALFKHELKRHIQDFFILCFKKNTKPKQKGLRMNLLRSLHSGLERWEAAWSLWRVPGPLSEPSSPQMRSMWCTPPAWGTGRSPEPTCCHPLQAGHKRTKEEGEEDNINCGRRQSEKSFFSPPDRNPACAWKQSWLSKHLVGN